MRRLEPGSPVLLDGHGSIRPTHRDAGYLPIAGGVGITPVLGILRSFADRRDGGPLTLLYASRNDDITFRDELIELQERLRLRVGDVLAEPPPNWQGASGRIDRPLLERVVTESARP